jgi:hypothetical protein
MSQELQGKSLVLWLSSTGANFKWVTCEISSNASISAGVTSVKTKCGTFTTTGDPETKIAGNGIVDAKPAANQVSFKQLEDWCRQKTLIYFIYKTLADSAAGETSGGSVYLDGQGRISEVTVTGGSEGMIEFSYALEATGTIDNTADS